LVKPPLCNCSTVLQIRLVGPAKYTSAIREGQVSEVRDSEMDVVGVLLNSYHIFNEVV